MDQRCDQIIHCRDKSDEDNCKLIVFEKSYKKKVPPFTTDPVDNSLVPVEVKVFTTLKNVLEISEKDNTIDLKLGITLKWYENRVIYHNLKQKEALNVLSDTEVTALFSFHFQIFFIKICHIKANFLWIPYIIFENTDNDEAVTVDGDTRTLMSVTRQGGFTRSGPEVTDEVKCYFVILDIEL